MDAYAIYQHARANWAGQLYPAYVNYTVRITAAEGGRTVTNTYDAFAALQSGQIAVHASSREELAHPVNGQGVAFHAKFSIEYSGRSELGKPPTGDGPAATARVTRNVRVDNAGEPDILGVPELSPAYSFGLRPPAAPALPKNAAVSALPTIASVTSAQRDYAIALDGTENVDGIPSYVLAMTPLHNPARYRLRKLWVAQDTFLTQQAVVQGNFTAGPSPSIPWMVHFATADGLTYIRDETALAPIRYRGRSLDAVSVAFDDVRVAEGPSLSWSLSLFKTSGDVLKEP
ncbi:MAG TPA: hypothetical protein VFL13_01695 [Candidatus Baltobacteraceae bacterium]|nr:hypothetical protein [Candidatus Baltobacteraceae bacterium]